MKATIKKIAELSGVSRGTVDKVIHDRPGVNTDTKSRVLQIIEELNYKPNPVAKALVQNQSPLKLGVILTPEYNTFIKYMKRGIRKAEDEFSPFGIQIITCALETLETEEHLNALQKFEDNGVDAIALFPINDVRVSAKVNSLCEKGVSVLTFNSRAKDINEFCFIGQDHVKGGRVAAGLMDMLLPAGGDIGIITSSHQLSCHDDRLDGFVQRLKERNSNVNIVEIRENQDRRTLARTLTTDYIQKYPELKGIYITGGGIEGVVESLNQANSSIKLIGHDLTDDSAQLLKSGDIDFIIDQNPVEQGYLIIKTMFEYLFKQIQPDKFIEVPIEVILAESL